MLFNEGSCVYSDDESTRQGNMKLNYIVVVWGDVIFFFFSVFPFFVLNNLIGNGQWDGMCVFVCVLRERGREGAILKSIFKRKKNKTKGNISIKEQ